jgi:hypothetical protein
MGFNNGFELLNTSFRAWKKHINFTYFAKKVLL